LEGPITTIEDLHNKIHEDNLKIQKYEEEIFELQSTLNGKNARTTTRIEKDIARKRRGIELTQMYRDQKQLVVDKLLKVTTARIIAASRKMSRSLSRESEALDRKVEAELATLE